MSSDPEQQNRQCRGGKEAASSESFVTERKPVDSKACFWSGTCEWMWSIITDPCQESKIEFPKPNRNGTWYFTPSGLNLSTCKDLTLKDSRKYLFLTRMFIFFNSLVFGSSGIQVQQHHYSKYMVRVSEKRHLERMSKVTGSGQSYVSAI